MADADETIAALDLLMEQERTAALTGDLDAIESLLERKETLLGALGNAAPLDGAVLRAIDAKARRNQMLLNGTLEGIRAVTTRLAAMRKIERALVTYDDTGRKRDHEIAPKSSIERRA